MIGAGPGEVLVTDSTTVNLYKLVNAVLDADPSLRTLVTDQDNFPTDRYVLEGIARARGLELNIFEGDTIPDGLVVLSHVNYRSGELADMEAIDKRHTVIWDLSHSAGAVPVELNKRGIRYAVGCTYKYLNAGPGAVGYLYVKDPESLRTPIQGWFGQNDQFFMERPYEPAPGITRFMAGTPPILVAGRGRGGRAGHGRGRDRGAAREVDRADRVADRAPRPVARAARLRARLAARPGTSAGRT